MKPLPASPMRVKRAAFLSPLLKTFVAPGFVDPYFLGSSKPRNLLIKIAKDNDPNKYEKKKINKIFFKFNIINSNI